MLTAYDRSLSLLNCSALLADTFSVPPVSSKNDDSAPLSFAFFSMILGHMCLCAQVSTAYNFVLDTGIVTAWHAKWHIY